MLRSCAALAPGRGRATGSRRESGQKARINVIARECGYSSSLILSRTLKRDAGMTPTIYRQERQAD
jgi:AraC-like DNA-binding protein